MASGVLRDVTNHKITRLVNQQSQFEKAKTSLLNDAEKSDDALSLLYHGLKDLGLDGKATDASLHNLLLFSGQSKRDASISPALTKSWEEELVSALDAKSRKYEFAALFSKLATEWADNPNEANVLLQSAASNACDSEGDSLEFQPVGREEMHKQRQEWDSHVFNEHKTDGVAIQDFLTNLFATNTKAKRAGKSPLELLREEVASFGVDKEGRPALATCDEDDVRLCVKGVLKSDLFTGKKRDALLDLVDTRPAVLKEIADVINMDASSLGGWKWQPSPVPAHLRRQLNGKYRVYIDPEIHQALLVHWIGLQFAIHLKKAFTSFFSTAAWAESQHASMGTLDRARRKFYLRGSTKGWETTVTGSVNDLRRKTFKNDFFMTQLPSSILEGYRGYGDHGEEKDGTDDGKSPLEIKQSLLRIATAEMLLHQKLHGKFNLVQTDFKWFGPSLPHSTIFAVLGFLHVPKYWTDFFRAFLAMPLVFPDDGPDATVRTRQCGVPISQSISDALGEAVLFCLDFAVNKATHGSVQLYRFHDDVWFWGQEDGCKNAWKTVTTFAEIMGLGINRDKTGSFSTTDGSLKDGELTAGLPQGQVRWGFLLFDSSKGRWIINTQSIDEHIVELRRQLVACDSVLAWIAAWNSYFSRFFSNNFGQAAHCLGKDHLDTVFSSFERIQREIFASLDASGNCKDVTSYLKQMIMSRFGAREIPDSFLAFPIEYGGLDVRNPFIPLMAMYADSQPNPALRLDVAFELEEEAYEEAKQEFEKGVHDGSHWEVAVGCDRNVFFSFDEYVRFPEQTSTHLLAAYEQLLEAPKVSGVELTNTVAAALKTIPAELQGCNSIKADWRRMDTYWRWVLQLYAKEAMASFGGLVLGERDMLPVELVKLLRSERVRWQG